MTAWLDTPDSPADPARDPRRAAALDRWLTEDRDRVATLLQQNRELTEEVMRQDDALLDAYDRIDELVDEVWREGDQHRDYRALLIVALVALVLLIGTRGL